MVKTTDRTNDLKVKLFNRANISGQKYYFMCNFTKKTHGMVDLTGKISNSFLYLPWKATYRFKFDKKKETQIAPFIFY